MVLVDARGIAQEIDDHVLHSESQDLRVRRMYRGQLRGINARHAQRQLPNKNDHCENPALEINLGQKVLAIVIRNREIDLAQDVLRKKTLNM
jgi:hypothetical protein